MKTKRKIRVEPFCADTTSDGIKTAWTLIPTIQVWYHSYFRQRHYGISILFLNKSVGVNVRVLQVVVFSIMDKLNDLYN